MTAQKQKDFNNLAVWLPTKLQERRISIDELAIKGRMSRTVIYMWLADQARPSTKSAGKLAKVLSNIPVWYQDQKNGWQQRIEEVTFEEIVQQFTERKVGRPAGSGSGPKAVTTRSRK